MAERASSTLDRRGDLEVRLLGGFAVAIGDAELSPGPWPSQRSVQLVQLLALAEGHRLAREQAIDALWPQLEPEAGGANLRKAAHHARQALGAPDAVVLQGGQVSLFPSRRLVVAAVRFEARARAALERRERGGSIEAAAAYRGELLPGAPYEPWLDPARTRLRALFRELLRAGEQWERLAQAEPTDEPAHRALMRRELASGNRPAAIRWYSHLRKAPQRSEE